MQQPSAPPANTTQSMVPPLPQIDSHMRFVRGWDERLLGMLRQAAAAAGHERVVLSSYPPGYKAGSAAIGARHLPP